MLRVVWCVPMVVALLTGCQSTGSSSSPGSTENRIKLAEIDTQLGIAYMREGDNELALNKLEKALAANPRVAETHNAIAVLYNLLGETQKAEVHYKTAIGLDPKNISTLNNYGLFLCQQGRYKQGQEKFEEAFSNPLNRAPANALTNAGTCAQQAKDPAHAEQYFRSALQIAPKLAPALLRMAQLSFDQQRFLEARGYFQRYLETDVQSAQTLWLGIRIEHGIDDRNASASYALELKNKFPDSPEYGLYLQGKFN